MKEMKRKMKRSWELGSAVVAPLSLICLQIYCEADADTCLSRRSRLSFVLPRLPTRVPKDRKINGLGDH